MTNKANCERMGKGIKAPIKREHSASTREIQAGAAAADRIRGSFRKGVDYNSKYSRQIKKDSIKNVQSFKNRVDDY